MAKNFKTLLEKMSPESQGRSRALANKYRAEMPRVFAPFNLPAKKKPTQFGDNKTKPGGRKKS